MKRLIEEWLPIAALGQESVRERTPMTPFPAPNRLHVWWARRPLVASRAAILASVLPHDTDRDRFMHILGIHGDPVASRRRIDLARRMGERFEGEAYTYKRAFTYNLTEDERTWIEAETRRAGLNGIVACDPTAGGGSIPFEMRRLGLAAFANDLNPVAALILRATVEWPFEYGLSLVKEFRPLADEFVRRREERLADLFPSEPDENAIPTNFAQLTGVAPTRCYVDRGYQGHGVRGDTAVFVAGRRRGITPTIRRELRRRSAIEAMIGHMKLDGKLARNHLKGALGDAIHALLCGAGHNLRLILRHLAGLLRALFQLLAALDPERDAALKPA